MAITSMCISAVYLLCLALLSNVVQGRGGRTPTDIPAPQEAVFNVLAFGANPNGRKDNTQAFMRAWIAACHWRGRSRLVIPAGTFLTGQVTFEGPCNSLAPIIVQVTGTITASTDISEYVSQEWFTFDSIQGLVLTGGGTFDGQGVSAWKYNDCQNNKDCQLLPTSIKFTSVTNANIRRINSINSKSFHIAVHRCTNLRMHRLHITAPGDSPNTDGIHVSNSTAIRISKSVIATGDDCISIGQGTTNISISKITCGPGHGISVGSLGKYPDEQDVTGVIVRNCTMLNTQNGVRIKTWPGSPPSQAFGFIFQDIIMNNVVNPIIIDQMYCPGSCRKQPSRVKISNVYYKNIRGTSTSEIAVNLMCSSQVPCNNVQLFDINLKYNGNKMRSLPAVTSSSCSNVKVEVGGVQIPPPCR